LGGLQVYRSIVWPHHTEFHYLLFMTYSF